MAQIGYIIEGIFERDRSYESFVEEYQGYLGTAGRLVTQEEFDSLRNLAIAAGSNTQITFALPTWSPRFHLIQARRAFSEMRAAHDRLFNTLDAYLAWANGNNIANLQLGLLQDEAVTSRAKRQIAVLERIGLARGGLRKNLANALQSAEELSNKYIRDPFRGPAQDRTNQTYYDAQAEIVRYNDLLNQFASLQIGDLHDEMAVNGLHAERLRDHLELVLVVSTVQNLRDREQLLGFDFTARIVDALTDVLQSASEVVRVVWTLWGLESLERLSPDYQTGSLEGWYFSFARDLWPTWVGHPIDEIAGILLSDDKLAYLDKADRVLSIAEHKLQEFDANATRTMLQVKLTFSPGDDGVSRATLAIPSAYRFQEVNALYLKGMPIDVGSVEARIKDARFQVTLCFWQVHGHHDRLRCAVQARPTGFGHRPGHERARS
jgi:hypothetical protein